MSRQSMPTIFGPVADGVPSPLIRHDHPYPTRYHGPIWNYPYFTQPYRENPYALAPYAGLGAPPQGLGACGACGVKAGGTSDLGAVNLTGSPSGSLILDGALGALVGAIVADKSTDRVIWAAGGAVATIVLGALGLAGTVGAGWYVRR